MKQIAILALAFVAACFAQGRSQEMSPVAGGIPNTNAGIFSGVPDSGRMVGRCVQMTSCFDSACTRSKSIDSGIAGADPGGIFVQHVDTRWCAFRLMTRSDSALVYFLADMPLSKWEKLDRVKDSLQPGEYIRLIGQFTRTDSLALTRWGSMRGMINSPIVWEKVTCENCSQ